MFTVVHQQANIACYNTWQLTVSTAAAKDADGAL
jgi:hypothetical protein